MQLILIITFIRRKMSSFVWLENEFQIYDNYWLIHWYRLRFYQIPIQISTDSK